MLTDITKPVDTSGWFPKNWKNNSLTKEQKAVIEIIKKDRKELLKTIEESNSASSQAPADTNMQIDNVCQESMPWTKVTNKKDGKTETIGNTNSSDMEITDSTMKKIKVTLTIRTPKDTSNFSPAKLHLDTLHEIHKFDDTMIAFNTSGNLRINIEAPMPEARYKDLFKPVEKRNGSGDLSSISISHEIFLTGKINECKEAIFPYLKKNKIFLYFNPKPGLEHFTAIGILFGPNPDYTWRDELADVLIETMKTEINQAEAQSLGTMENNQPKILLSLNTQTIGISKPVETTSVALEIRVPTGSERIYTNILERLYEKAANEEIIIPSKLGNFFPYYMKSKLAETFSILMQQQNADMSNTAVIPIFGYTPSARQQRIKIKGEETTVELAVATTPDIIRIKATPSTQNLYKYLIIVKKENRTSVQKSIQGILHKITEPLENQPTYFPFPRCGGRETLEPTATRQEDTKMSAYMSKLDTIAQAQNPQDAGPAEPPKRFRKITISYAGAVTTGILKQSNFSKNKPNTPNNVTQDSDTNNQEATDSIATHRQVSWDGSTTDTSRSAGSSLSRSITNSKKINFKKDIDEEIKELKDNLESRMDRQDQRMKT
jgi:hypothetical protein